MWARSDSILNKFKNIQTIGASQTDALISQAAAPVTGDGLSLMRIDVYTGFVTAATGVSVKVQSSTGYNIWDDTKSASILASSNKTFTANPANNQLTSTAHGLSSGDVVVLSSTGSLPTGLQENTKYFVEVIDANTLELYDTANRNSNTLAQFSDAGSGTHSLAKVSKVSITFNPNVAGDQAYLPLGNVIRVVASTGAGDSLQVVDIVQVQKD